MQSTDLSGGIIMGSIRQEDVIQILKMVAESQIDELDLETGDLKLRIKKERKTRSVDVLEFRSEEPLPKAYEKQPPVEGGRDRKAFLSHSPEKLPQSLEPPISVGEEKFMPVRAPMLGTFYRAPKPEAPPFVEEGQFIKNDDVVCIIEVMKLFNMVRAGVQGRIAKICAENAQLVEYNQVLFWVETEEGYEKAAEGSVS